MDCAKSTRSYERFCISNFLLGGNWLCLRTDDPWELVISQHDRQPVDSRPFIREILDKETVCDHECQESKEPRAVQHYCQGCGRRTTIICYSGAAEIEEMPANGDTKLFQSPMRQAMLSFKSCRNEERSAHIPVLWQRRSGFWRGACTVFVGKPRG